MPTSRTPLPSHPLVLFAVALLGGSLVWQPGLGARGPQQPPSAEQRRVERMSQRATDRVRALQTEADELASRERTLLGEIRQLEIDRQIKAEELAASPGEPVYAIHEGEVVSVGTFEGLGTLVIVSHGDQAFSLYGYLGSLAVHEGVQVGERAELGTAGVSPTGDANVYFELRIDGRPVDPVEWLKQ